MSSARRTYDQVHSGLRWFYGRASEFLCVDCERPAKHWCYQYTAGDSELVSPTGAPYSESFEDYAPMCWSCHKSFDMKMDPGHILAVRRNGLRAAARNNARANADPDWASERARRINSSIRARVLVDPEFAALYSEGKRRAAMSGGMAQRRMCAECGLISNCTGLHRHQTHRDHVGYFDAVRTVP